MPNETKTSKIVRDHFCKYPLLKVEEQQSDDEIINQALKKASKGGFGKGFPDFIITHKNQPNFVIVIECKPQTSKHSSADLSNPKDYAFDGARYYALHLAKYFDVLAIGVSGETKKEIKVSHSLILKNTKAFSDIFSNQLLSSESYLEGFLLSEEKQRQDYESLVKFTSDLNKKLDSYKILEANRALLTSALLISLENRPFKKSFNQISDSSILAKNIALAIEDELKNSGMKKESIEQLLKSYDIISSESNLLKEKRLSNLLTSLDENFNSFSKTNKYFDVVTQFYVEFLSYAAREKQLGIVLTPNHITDLFCDLVGITKDSIVYDNCTGTGGFLISALKRMTSLANGNKEKIQEIKKNQLIGVEENHLMFALAVANMYIHQDGKTSLLKGDCFDQDIKDKVLKIRPTIGVLNPPYQNKNNPIWDLEFILENLDCLVEGGKCAAIIKNQNAMTTNIRVKELKKRLLEKHTLEAVLSMPNELFINQANVVPCVMIFTAKKPHPRNKNVFFGYFKDDGFDNRKKRRMDYDNKWENIKAKWLDLYLNNIEDKNLSVVRKITFEDEWLAEAYMETDYTSLRKEDFEETVKSFLLFKQKYEVD